MHIHCQHKFGLPQCNLQTELSPMSDSLDSLPREASYCLLKARKFWKTPGINAGIANPSHINIRRQGSFFPRSHVNIPYLNTHESSFTFMIIHTLGGFGFGGVILLLCFFIFYFYFCLRVFCNLGWPWILKVTVNNLKLLALLPHSSTNWNSKNTPPH